MGDMRKWLARIDNQSNLQRLRCKMVNAESVACSDTHKKNLSKNNKKTLGILCRQ